MPQFPRQEIMGPGFYADKNSKFKFALKNTEIFRTEASHSPGC